MEVWSSDPVSLEPDSSVSSMPVDSDPPEGIWCGEKYSLPLCREKLQLLTKGVVQGGFNTEEGCRRL